MIEIKPQIIHSSVCPACHTENVPVLDCYFQGKHVLANCQCASCGFVYYDTLPIGHDKLFPIQFSVTLNRVYCSSRSKDWLAGPLINSMANEGLNVTITKIVHKLSNKVVIVNCLDNCFGHVFTKVWNAYTLIDRHPELGVIVIIPANLKWLLPDMIAEAWLIDIAVHICDQKISNLDEYVKMQLPRYKLVYLSHTYTHLDHTRFLDMEKVLKMPRFNLAKFEEMAPTITFVLREDRFWLSSLGMSFLYKVAIKLGKLHMMKSIFVARQNHLVKCTAEKILMHVPNARIFAIGLGKTGKISFPIQDLRMDKIIHSTEKEWNLIYSYSHVIIGVHGSHMLIPTALAAGFINLVPCHKIEHMAEDTLLPYNNRYLHFLGRFLDINSKRGLIVNHTISIIRSFPYLYQNTAQNPE